MLYPIQNVSGVIGQVLLPAFSRIQADNERFRAAYVRSCMLIGLVTFPVMLGMAVVAEPLVRAVLGPKWISTILLFQILAPVGLIQSIQTTIGHIYVAKGRTDWMFRWALAATALLIVSFLIGVRYGVTGVAISYCVAYFGLLAYPGFLIPFRLIDLPVGEFIRCLWPQFGITLVMAAVCAAWLKGLAFAHIFHPWVTLVSTSLLGVLVYVFLMVRFRPTVILYLEEAVAGHQSGVAGRCLKVIGLFPAS
jgi:PST family polysaccharide transporter